MSTFKYMKTGRTSKALKEFLGDIKQEFSSKGIDGNFQYSSIEDLQAIRDAELLKLKSAKPKTEPQTIETDTTMSKKGVEITDFPKKETTEPIAPEPQVETNVDFSDFDFSGVTQDIKQREYNEMPVTEHMGVDIPEPVVGNTFQAMINKQNSDDASAEAEHGGGGSEGGGAENVKSEPIGNPAMNDLDDKEKTFAAEQLVDAVLAGYDGLHQIARHYVGFNDKKVTKLINDGEISDEVTFAIDLSGEEVNISQYAEIFNEEVKEIFTPDPEFNQKVRPAMVREAKKMNLGITDRQFILGMFAKDIATKGAQAVGLKQSANGIINSLKELQLKTVQQSQPAVSPDVITRPSNDKRSNVEDVEYEQG